MVADHATLFRGITSDSGNGHLRPSAEDRPVLIERTEEDFISALLQELRSDDGRKRLATSVKNAGEPPSELKLLQPVHRSFNLVLFEAACDAFGEPRLDPAKIESAGMVVRRRNPDTKKLEGWMKLGGEVHGWVPLESKRELEQDPDPTRRQPFKAGHPELDIRLQQTLGAPLPYEESASLLFTAPPDISAATHRTLLYGMVPVASSESVSRTVKPPPAYDQDEIRCQLAPHFTVGAAVNLSGIAGKQYTRNYRDELLKDTRFSSEKERNDATERLEQFITLLRKLVSVFNAFEHQGMHAALNGITLDRTPSGSRRLVGDALALAAEILVHQSSDKTFVMPQAWPLLSESQVSALVRAGAEASNARLKDLLPCQGRFELPKASYEVHAFIRVRRDDGCPPLLLWTPKPSQPFAIAAWYESGKLPPVQVALPPLTQGNLGAFKPNVAFSVPKNIFNLLSSNKAQDFLEGKAKAGSDSGPDWICGFNIPIITLCAFIVLNIFLSLLNIVFWWIALIKICIPVPRRSSS